MIGDVFLALIYGGHSAEEQGQIYAEISQAKTELTTPLMLIEDFNQVLQVSERRGMAYENQGMRAFREWLDSLGVVEIALTGRKYTWRRGNSCSRIDRCFVETSWLQQFPTMAMKSVEMIFSDHVAVDLIDRRNWGPKPFRFMNMWLTHPSFKDLFYLNGTSTISGHYIKN